MIRVYNPAPEKCCYLKLVETNDNTVTLIATNDKGKAYFNGTLLLITSKGIQMCEGISDEVLDMLGIKGTTHKTLPIC